MSFLAWKSSASIKKLEYNPSPSEMAFDFRKAKIAFVNYYNLYRHNISIHKYIIYILYVLA